MLPLEGVEFSYGLMQALGIERAVVAGHSAGASIAVDLAIAHPEAVSGLILVSPALTVDSKGFLARADLGQLLRFAATRVLLSTDAPGLNFVRRQIGKRQEEVKRGAMGIYYDEDEVPFAPARFYLPVCGYPHLCSLVAAYKKNEGHQAHYFQRLEQLQEAVNAFAAAKLWSMHLPAYCFFSNAEAFHLSETCTCRYQVKQLRDI